MLRGHEAANNCSTRLLEPGSEHCKLNHLTRGGRRRGLGPLRLALHLRQPSLAHLLHDLAMSASVSCDFKEVLCALRQSVPCGSKHPKGTKRGIENDDA